MTYDRLSTLRAIGRNLAATDGYVWVARSWREIHPDADARRIIEAAYLESIFEKAGEHLLRDLSADLGQRVSTRGGFV